MRPYTRVKNTSFAPGNISIKWYEDGTLNLAANCLDRHLAERGDQTAIIWEGDDASQSKHITYRELHADVCRFANVLLDLGLKRRRGRYLYADGAGSRGGDAGLRPHRGNPLGHFRRLLAGGVAGRIIDSSSRLVITADEGLRAGRAIPLKKTSMTR